MAMSKREQAILTMAAILAGRKGMLEGTDLWDFLPMIGVAQLGVAKQRGFCGYSDQLVFLRDEKGEIKVAQVYPAGRHDADFIRRIVGYCSTEHRGCPETVSEKFPTVEELVEQLKASLS